ncbi:unnamed protein product [Soboliphyme baturini]|uniref:Hexosyltransferase n=1 Tax=Soboliphyme baturini TaxID=241478 RepID=A0A183J9Q0_9BILA|nr:unnamed protein product [Soboliphyme baturini]
MGVLFAMGSADQDLNDAVKTENDHFHDIIQENFLDSYKNLSHKAIMWLKWTALYCPQASYVLKIDDDVFLEPFRLLRVIKLLNEKHNGLRKSIACMIWDEMDVIRENTSKWYVTDEEYSEDIYPPYCSGSAYLLSADSVFPLYRTSLNMKLFWVDDVYVTGILRWNSNLELQSIASTYTLSCRQRLKDFDDANRIFCHMPGSLDKVYELWNYTLRLYDTDLTGNKTRHLLTAIGDS